MAKVSPNLKTKVTADTSGFTKGMAQAKKETAAFENFVNDATSKMASAFGVNTAQIEKLQNAVGGLGRKLSEMGGKGAEALGNIVASAGKAAVAIGAIGIGAAVSAFKLLNQEAETFKNTIQGANIALQTQAYLNTYRQAMHDANEEIGQSIAESEAQVERWWGRFTTNLASTAAVAVATPGKWYDTFLPTGIIRAAKQVSEQVGTATQKAEDASDIAGVIYSLTRRQSDASRDWADAEARITELRRIAADDDYDILTRTRALAEAKDLITKKQAEQYDIQLMISNLTDLMSEQASDSIEDAEAANAAYVSAVQNLAAMDSELKALNKQQASLTKQAQKEADARKESAAAVQKGVSRLQQYATNQIEMYVSEESVTAIHDYLEGALAHAPIQVPVGIDITPAKQNMLDLTETLQTTFVEAVEGIAEALGNLIGNLTSGQGGVAEFGQDLLTMFGTFAQKFGKVLVAFGVAVEAAKESAASFNGIAAIIAGGALIAAGAAVKAVASNMATAMGAAASSGSYIASSASYGSSALTNDTLKVEVTGTLTANGSQLVAVLNNENTRKKYTT
ncbi:MAG: hypothetical protein J5639_09310 [Bacteroidales bacterium]|nr:hypothetical protein [Bacteroidales bacterium]